MTVATRLLPGIRSNLALDADHTSIVERPDHLVLATPTCPNYWEGNCIVLDAPPASWDDTAEVWMNALARWRTVIAASSIGAVSHPMVRWESIDSHRASKDRLPADTVSAQDTVLRLEGMPSAVGAPPAVECRPAETDADWDAIVAMVLEEARDDAHASYVRWAYAALRRRFESTGSVWWTARERGLVVGSLGLFRSEALWRFQEVDTRASHRGRGIASLLVARALADRPVHTRPDVYMVAETGGAPERLYRRLGFVPVSWIHCISWQGPT